MHRARKFYDELFTRLLKKFYNNKYLGIGRHKIYNELFVDRGVGFRGTR